MIIPIFDSKNASFLMSLTTPTPALLRSLGKMLRGLSALFWGLPLVLISSVQSQTLVGARELALFIPCITNGMLVFGLSQLTHFNSQERIWREAIDRAKVVAVINAGLSPFLYFWARLPTVPLYTLAVDLLYISSLLFLCNYNRVLYRLTTMLPDESLRSDARLFTQLNRSLLATIAFLSMIYLIVHYVGIVPSPFYRLMEALEVHRSWFAIFLLLAPVAMTMAMTWKIKELIIDGVFNSEFWQYPPLPEQKIKPSN